MLNYSFDRPFTYKKFNEFEFVNRSLQQAKNKNLRAASLFGVDNLNTTVEVEDRFSDSLSPSIRNVTSDQSNRYKEQQSGDFASKMSRMRKIKQHKRNENEHSITN